MGKPRLESSLLAHVGSEALVASPAVVVHRIRMSEELQELPQSFDE